MQRAKPRKRRSERERQERVVRYPDYHDHSNRSDDWVLQRQAELASEATTTVGAKKHFPNQLYHMLESVEGTAYSQIVRWLPHGRSFAVLDKARFVLYVLPAYFPSQNALSSFQRQLNSYGFRRLTREEDGYYHELFLRSRPSMVSLISRSPLSQYSTRRRFDPASEPNLCDMPWLPDIVVASGRSFQSIDGATDCNEKDSPRLLSQITQSFLSTSQMLRPARQKVEPRVKTQHDERPHTTTDCSQPFSVVGMEFYAPLSHEGTLTKAERHKASTRRLISSALAVTDFSTTNFQPSSSLQSSFLHGGGYMMTERLFPCQGRSVKHPKRSIHEQIHGPPFTTLICATNINDPTNSPHEGVGSSFDSESSFEDQNDSRLCEWAEFLDDVNLDASSTSSDEKQPRP